MWVWVSVRVWVSVHVWVNVRECVCVGPVVPNCKQPTCRKCCVAVYDIVLTNGPCRYGHELQ